MLGRAEQLKLQRRPDRRTALAARQRSDNCFQVAAAAPPYSPPRTVATRMASETAPIRRGRGPFFS